MRKWNYYLIVSLAEIAILIVFMITAFQEKKLDYSFTQLFWAEQEPYGRLYTESIPAPEGIYEITIQYEKERSSAITYAEASEVDVQSLNSDRVRLSSLKRERSFDIYVNHDVPDLHLVIEPQDSLDFIIYSIEIRTAGNSVAHRIFQMALVLLLMNLVTGMLYFRKRNFSRSYEVTGILVIGAIASLALFSRYMLYGHDLLFHLFRIEGLKEGLLSGQFPVRMQPGWFNGYGYPVSVMYGDTLLYFPAILRLFGVTVQNAYKVYIAFVNIGTAAVAYYVFYRIAKDKNVALFGSCLYTLFPYRLSMIYVRAALGEYTAMLFLPLVFLGLWYVFEREEDEAIPADRLAAPIIGFSGLIQTHVLSCLMIATMIFILCIINIRRLFQKNRLVYLVKVAVITGMINLWFLVPFFRYMQEDLNVVADRAAMSVDFQKFGADFEELFAFYWNGTLSDSWGAIAPLGDKFPKPVGMAYVMILVMAILLYHKGKMQRLGRKAFICMGLLTLTVFMSSWAFPYFAIGKALPLVGKILATIQFSWRYLSMAGIFGSILAVIVMVEIENTYGRKTAIAAVILVSLLSVLQGSQLITSVLYSGNISIAYDIAAYESNSLTHGEEYLYSGTFGHNTEALQEPVTDGAVITYYDKERLTVTMTCKSESQNAYVLLPLYYYVGYEARDIESNELLAIERSEDNSRLKVNLPVDYEGTIRIEFREPVSFRVAEMFSLLTMLGLLFYWGYQRRLKEQCERNKAQI